LRSDGLYVRSSYENFVEGNTVNEKSLVYLENEAGLTVTDAGQVVLVNSTQITVSGLNLVDADMGLVLWLSSDCLAVDNVFQNNLVGVLVGNSNDNTFYHNHFLDNPRGHVYIPSYASASVNTWDDGYPSGGNYWGNYDGIDQYHGPDQNLLGSDGIGDSPHFLGAGNVDNYPLYNPIVALEETTITYGGEEWSIEVTSNVTVTEVITGDGELTFQITGDSGSIGYVRVIIPFLGLVPQVLVDDEPLPSPFPVITNNATHLFIYFEVMLSTHEVQIIFDTSGPIITVTNPTVGYALQDGVTFEGSIIDIGSGVFSYSFSIREADGLEGRQIGFENLPVEYDAETGLWSLQFDTLQIPDGYYLLHIEATDNFGNTASANFPYSIRNWAVIELLPRSEIIKAGQTVPIKFALRVSAGIDPAQPFIYNEDLTILVFATDNPGTILQESTFGEKSTDYRISAAHYITNFKTLKKPTEYTTSIYRGAFKIGDFTFRTNR
jgi:parallel beta-helix repeat protein